MALPRSSRMALLLLAAALGNPVRAAAQTSDHWGFQACTTSGFVNCGLFDLRFAAGGGEGGMNLFTLLLQNQGSPLSPGTPTSFYNFVFGTGENPADPGTELDLSVAPEAEGGAVVTDATPWSVFESGDAIFYSALGGNGVGNCVGSAPIGGFGQAGLTCGPSEFLSFSFSTSRSFDLTKFSLLDLEAVALTEDLTAGSCGVDPACEITAPPDLVVTPEPISLLLTGTGLAGIAAAKRRRRKDPKAGKGRA